MISAIIVGMEDVNKCSAAAATVHSSSDDDECDDEDEEDGGSLQSAKEEEQRHYNAFICYKIDATWVSARVVNVT